MKIRHSLLFGLGIMLTLSIGAPVSAATDTMGNVDALSAQSGITEANDLEKTATSVIAFTSEDVSGKTKWKISVDGNVITGTRAVKAEGKIWFVKDDYLAAGVQAVSEEEGKVEGIVILEAGTYYFDNEGADPSKSSMGQLMKNQWALGEDGKWYWMTETTGAADNTGKTQWQQIEDNWYYLDDKGTPDTTKTGLQEVKTHTWYYLNSDGEIDESVTGWKEAAGGKWLSVDKGIGTEKSGWQEIKAGTWYYLKDDFTRDASKTGLQQINGATYLLSEDGSVKTGFQTIDGKQYYFNADGKRFEKTGWQTVDNKPYYFNDSYQVTSANTTGWQLIDGSYYYFENGNMLTGWKKSGTRWYYMDPSTGIMKTGFYTVSGAKYYSDGSGAMLEGGWHQINNTWYYMQGSGAVSTGWLSTGSIWYWLGSDGAMATGWYTADNRSYYSDGTGAMKTGWLLSGGKWYYLAGSGAMETGWVKPDGHTWYYLNKDGSMATGWLKEGGAYYYLTGSGAMATRWQKLGDYWYYFNNGGVMLTGWYQDYGTWYYSDGNGHMLTGWQLLGGSWYYLGASGAMSANKWIDTYYYVGSSGAMLKNAWVGQYYVGADGRWVPGYNPVTTGGKWVQENGKWYYQTGNGARLTNQWQKLNGNWFWFDTNGVMATGWKYIGGLKYYFNSDGHMLQDLDSVIGRQSSYRITINRVKCQVTVYARDGGNGYIIPCKTFTCSVGLNGTTPVGTFRTLAKYDVKELMGPSWGKWATRIVGGVLFHSVACGNSNPTYALPAGEYNKLGQPASHGCVRLNVRDAKWIYDNCSLGTEVQIGDSNITTPFDRPATIKIPLSQNWDPTDPAVGK